MSFFSCKFFCFESFLLLMTWYFVFRIRIREDSQRGSSLLKIASVDNGKSQSGGSNAEFSIVEGNEDGVFQILR